MTVLQFFDIIIDLFFPNVCGICDEISKTSVCKKCIGKINTYKNVKIIRNFKNLEIKLNSKIYFDEQIYLYKYKGIIREKFIQYKFESAPYLYKMFAEIILEKKLFDFCKKYSLIIPVPISKSRYIERGYNQTTLIAKEIVRKIQNDNIKIETKILYKVKNISPQSTMKSKEDRIQNVDGVFNVVDSRKVKNKNVIIFDDIFTTGSTVNECAKILKQAGAKRVGIVTIAKD